MLADLRYALRLIRRSPGFGAAAVLTLALGIGLTTMVFSITDGVLFRPLPYPDPDRLVALFGAVRAEHQVTISVSLADFSDWRSQNRTFSDLAAYSSGRPIRTIGKGEAVIVPCMQVSANFLGVLGVSPLVGRGFDQDDEQPATERRALITYAGWMRLFGGDPTVVGRTVPALPAPLRIVGVLPRTFEFPAESTFENPDVLIPLTFGSAERADRHRRILKLVGRLRPSISLDVGRREMDAIALRLRPLFVPQPNTFPGAFDGVTLTPLKEQMGRRSKPTLAIIFGTVCFVLLIGCVNVATLLLARGIERQRELAVRAALGASSLRLVRQLFAENAVLAVGGAGLGLLLTYWSFGFVVNLIPPRLQLIKVPVVDHRVLFFALATSMATAVLFGLLPALKLSRPDVADSLSATSRTTSTARGTVRGVLIAGGGLLANSFLRIQLQETGFASPSRVLTMQVLCASPERTVGSAATATYVRDLVERVQRVPGVTAAAVTINLLTRSYLGSRFVPPSGAARRTAYVHIVSDDYFRARARSGKPCNRATAPWRLSVSSRTLVMPPWISRTRPTSICYTALAMPYLT